MVPEKSALKAEKSLQVDLALIAKHRYSSAMLRTNLSLLMAVTLIFAAGCALTSPSPKAVESNIQDEELGLVPQFDQDTAPAGSISKH